MFEIDSTEEFDEWIAGLRDRKGRAIILRRIDRIRLGNFGNVEPVGEGISELKIHFGPGYRVYFKSDNQTLILLLLGGDKDTQDDDIRRAKELAANL
jgi:putative addiction module killer protein